MDVVYSYHGYTFGFDTVRIAISLPVSLIMFPCNIALCIRNAKDLYRILSVDPITYRDLSRTLKCDTY